jgi:uncharacterized protein
MLQAKQGEMPTTHPFALRALSDVLTLRWRPDSTTLVALASYALVIAGMLIAFQVFTTAQTAANFLTFGPITIAGLGVALPAFYTALKRKRPLSDLGLSTRHLLPSLAIGLILGLFTYWNTLRVLDVAWTISLVPVISMALAVGLFEAVFFRGWLQLRFEEAFGLVPAIVLGAGCYSLYHVGYGMSLDEMATLFVLRLVFAIAFRLTSNVAVLWPFFTPVGGLYTNVREGLTMPVEATIGFVLTIALMAALLVVAARIGRGQKGAQL